MGDPNQDQIDLISEELEDLDRQVATGDLDAGTADALRAKYVAELTRITDGARDAGALVESGEAVGEAMQTPGTRRISGRAMAGTAIVAVAIAAVGVFAINSLTESSTAGVEGVASDVLTGEGGVDLSQVSTAEMEDVVAENPTVVGMRLALARRYFEAGTFDAALNHYLIILDQEKHPEALANVGWMTYLSGRPDVALEYVEAALQRQPTLLTAIWFLGNIQYSLGNFDAATAALEEIIAADGIPDEIRQGAESLLLEIEQQ